MFEVVEKETELPIEVYSIRDDNNGYPTFLIYKEDQWLWISAKHFRPISDE